ncbi:MAG: hypothetical protein RBS40_12040 [Rhodocyclaceae bacterium]|jgi:hypothetical protein|nr:hypothetical protein [Rhodocyclaceae bacterium]
MAQTAPTLPLAAWLLGTPGLLCLVAGAILLAGDFATVHPLLAEPGTILALAVSGIALVGSAAFPAVLARLAAQDTPPQR